MKQIRRSMCLGASAICLLGGVTSSAHALVISPARSEIRLLPGQKTAWALTATNDDKVEIQVDVSKKDWLIPDTNKGWTVERWLQVHGPARFYLKPGETRQIDLTVKCPKPLVGEVVGMTSFLYQTETPSMVTPMISVSLYLIATGTEKISGEVTSMMVREWQNQLTISATLKATGNVHLRPQGRLIVLDSNGKQLGDTLVPEGQPTFPGKENVYSGTLPGTVKLTPGKYMARAELTYQNMPFQGQYGFIVSSDGQIHMDQ